MKRRDHRRGVASAVLRHRVQICETRRGMCTVFSSSIAPSTQCRKISERSSVGIVAMPVLWRETELGIGVGKVAVGVAATERDKGDDG